MPSLPSLLRAHEHLPASSPRAISGVHKTGARPVIGAKQTAFVSWLSAHGASNIETLPITNNVSVELPVGEITAGLSRPDVKSASFNAQGHPAAYANGYYTQRAVRTDQMFAASITGHNGGRTLRRQTVAIIEVLGNTGMDNWPLRDHPIWIAAEGHRSRLLSVKDCRFAGCPLTSATTPPSFPPGDTTHGDRVMAAGFGSIESGQDPNVSGAFSQAVRSGAIRDTYLRYYGTDDAEGFARAIDQAVVDGVDAINFSILIYDYCNPSADYSGMNAVIRSAASAGVVTFASAGNYPPGLEGITEGIDCTVCYPATRPDVIAVNAIDTNEPPGPIPPYEETVLEDTAYGGMDIPTYGGAGGNLNIATIAIAAPGCSAYAPIQDQGVYTYQDPYNPIFPAGVGTTVTCATSIASPIAAAMFVGMRDGFFQSGTTLPNGRHWMANILLMGDGMTAGTPYLAESGVDYRAGAGRIRGHWPAELETPWSWGTEAVGIHEGEHVAIDIGDSDPEPSGITQLKWAYFLVADYPDELAPKVWFWVENACPPGGGTEVISLNTAWDLRGRYRVDGSSVSGACVRLHAYGYSVQPEGTGFWSAYYYHGGDPTLH